jgi:hypothetical protein
MFLLGSIWHCTHFVPIVSEYAKVVNLGTIHVYETVVPLQKFLTCLVCGACTEQTL